MVSYLIHETLSGMVVGISEAEVEVSDVVVVVVVVLVVVVVVVVETGASLCGLIFITVLFSE